MQPLAFFVASGQCAVGLKSCSVSGVSMSASRRLVYFLLIALCLPFQAAFAAETDSYRQPGLISLGFGGFDVLKNVPRRETYDARLEYRFSTSILSSIDSSLKSLDETFQLRPMMGIETSPQGQAYGFGGLMFDVLLGKHVVISPNVVLGCYERGIGKKLGYPLEFRSTMEAGFRFDNGMRLTGFFGHISNAGLGRKNPGAETAGVYIHVPVQGP